MTVVGGKLTTYRRMAQDAVDAAVAAAPAAAPGPAAPATCRWSAPPPATSWPGVEAPARLVRRYGTEAPAVLADARRAPASTTPTLLAPVADGCP